MGSRNALALFILTISAIFAFSGCGVGYILRSAYVGGGILARRTPLDQAASLDDALPVEREKLPLVAKAREFAEKRGFGGGKIFSQYSRLDAETLTWVVVASRDDSFELRTWWFPIVGTVPYKGFFNKDEAIALAKELVDQGYETSIRGADALSTLGWFNDPVVTPMLRNSDFDLVTTVLHELVHAKLWIPGKVDLNESMAQFLALSEAVKFFAGTDKEAEAQATKERAFSVAEVVQGLVGELDTLYQSDKSRQDKLAGKQLLFEKYASPLRATYPGLKILTVANNAELIQTALYTKYYKEFQTIYDEVGGDPAKFLEKMENYKKYLSD
jgi:predicted aminopeptidase